MCSMKKLTFTLLLMLSSFGFSQESKFGDIVTFTANEPISISNITINFQSVTTEGCGKQKSTFIVQSSTDKQLVSHIHGCEVFPTEFNLGSNRYMLELDSSLALGIELEDSQLVLWTIEEWNKGYNAKLNK